MAIQNTFYLDVDIKRDNYVEEPQVTQNDSVKFVLRVTDDGADYGMADASTYTLASLRPDGQSVLTIGSLTAPNEVTFELGSTEVSVPGRVRAAIQLYDADGRVSSIPFTYEVTKDIAVDYVPSADDRTLIQLVLGEGPAILAAAEQATISANTAATNATNAIEGFDAVLAEAVTATSNANAKAELANTAATNASEKAILADEKATLANTAAESATEATSTINLALPNVINLEYIAPYNASTQYRKNNIVRHARNSYIALQDTLGNEPTGNIDSPFWGVIAIGGADGTGSGTVTSVNGVEPDDTGNVTLTVTSSWADLTGKPTSFPSTIPLVAGLQNALDLKFTVAKAGSIDDLTTTTKANLVAAINEINAKPTGGDTTEIAKQINMLYDLTTGLIRYRAYDELQKQASSRIDGGTVFAHDMNGNIIGMTLDEANSQNIIIRDGKMMMIAKSEVTKTVTDATVVTSAYDTSGNGGRKLVRLKDGTLVTGVLESSTNKIKLYTSIEGTNWSFITDATNGLNTIQGFSLVAIGNVIGYVFQTSNNTVYFRTSSKTGTLGSLVSLDTSQTAIGSSSLTINPEGTELHAAWASKNSTYANSFNIRYAKGVISQVDGSVTWGTVVQISKLTNTGTDFNHPTLVLNSSYNPVIIGAFFTSADNAIHANVYDGTTWSSSYLGMGNRVFGGGTYVQSSPSAIFIPKSINGLANGLIANAWHGYDATHPSTFYIRFSKSIDGGVNWTAMQKLVAGQNASITYDKYGNLYIEYERGGSTYFVKSTNNGDSWGTETLKGVGANPSTLLDSSLDITKPLSIRKGTSSVVFNGEWKELVETPTLTAKAVYNVPSTDYVGAFVKKIGVTNVQAYVNDTLMGAKLVDNEYEFTKQLATEAPVKLRLELSRTSTSGGESDAVTRILGGRA